MIAIKAIQSPILIAVLSLFIDPPTIYMRAVITIIRPIIIRASSKRYDNI